MGDLDPEIDRVREVLDNRDGSTAGLAEWRQLKSHLTAQQMAEEKVWQEPSVRGGAGIWEVE